MPAGRYAEVTEGLLRTTVLDTVGDLLLEHEWDSLSMAVMARAAGVSRQTLYNEFGTRDDLAEAYVLREAGAFLDQVEEAVEAHVPDLEAGLCAGIERFLVGAQTHPALLAITTGNGSAALLSSLVSGPGSPVLAVAVERLGAVIGTHWPAIPAPERSALVAGVVRLAVSHATQPSAPTPQVAVAEIFAVVGPALRAHAR